MSVEPMISKPQEVAMTRRREAVAVFHPELLFPTLCSCPLPTPTVRMPAGELESGMCGPRECRVVIQAVKS